MQGGAGCWRQVEMPDGKELPGTIHRFQRPFCGTTESLLMHLMKLSAQGQRLPVLMGAEAHHGTEAPLSRYRDPQTSEVKSASGGGAPSPWRGSLLSPAALWGKCRSPPLAGSTVARPLPHKAKPCPRRAITKRMAPKHPVL